MKLYNLYKEIILEAVDIKTVQDAIKNNLGVNIVYEDNSMDSNSGPRYCQILAMGKTSKGNIAVRVYQISGPNLKRGKTGGIIRWKTFRIDRIRSMNVTNFTFYAPPDELYNALGDKTLNIPNNDGVANMAIFSDKNLDKYRERHAKWQSDVKTKKANEPLVRNRDDNEEKTQQTVQQKSQPNYPTAKDYQYSNLYSDKVADEKGNQVSNQVSNQDADQEEIENIKN